MRGAAREPVGGLTHRRREGKRGGRVEMTLIG